MSDMKGITRSGHSLGVFGLVFAGTALAAGIAYWVTEAEQVSRIPVASTVRGSSFDSAPQPAPTPGILTEESPAVVSKPGDPPVERVAVSEKQVLENLLEAPAPKPEPEAPKASAPVDPPVNVPVVIKPLEAKPAADTEPPQLISFTKLAFRYWPQTKDKGARDPFPAEIRALNGKRVIVDGYMFPVDFEKGKVRSFLLSRAMFGCCYGDSPKITEIIKVMRADGKTMPYQAMASVTGILEVGEEFDSEGYIDSVYRIKADDVGTAPLKR